MHVLQIGCHLDPLGRAPEQLLAAWPTLPAVAEAAARAGVQVTVVQAATTDCAFHRNGVAYRFVKQRSLPRVARRCARLAPSPRLARVAAAIPADLIHFHGLALVGCLRSVQREASGVPLIAQDHADRVPHWWSRALAPRCLAAVNGALFTSRVQAEPFVARGVFPPGLPIYEVLESSTRFSPGDQEAGRRATGLHGDPCLLWIGRLDRNKDPFTVLEAVHLALPQLPGLHLWVFYTAAPLEARIRRWLAARPHVAQRVHLMGGLPHPVVEQACRAADFYLSGSHQEGSGYALIEALACGLTPVVTDIPSFRRITRDAAVGALIPPGDAVALAQALVRVAARDRLVQRAEARRHFEEFLSFEVVGRELREVYESILREA